MSMKYKTQSEKERHTRMKNLERAAEAFSNLNRLGSHDGTRVPNRYQGNFLMASYAVSVLNSLDKGKLLRLEDRGIIHNSTLSGSSLLMAKDCIERYVSGDGIFTQDNYEQLSRTCVSVKNLIEKKIIS
jgi:hypothetical protein